jgi:hypothetical protein
MLELPSGRSHLQVGHRSQEGLGLYRATFVMISMRKQILFMDYPYHMLPLQSTA